MTVDPSTTNGRSSESQEVSPLDSIPSLPLFLEAQKVSQHNAGKVAVIDAAKGEQFSYTQLLVDTAELKKTILEDLGLKDLEERRIAFLVPNGYDYVVIQWAIWAAGGVYNSSGEGIALHNRRLRPIFGHSTPCIRQGQGAAT